MRKSKLIIRSIVAFILILLIIIFAMFINNIKPRALLFNELMANEISQWKTNSEETIQTEGQMGISNMKLIAEDGGVSLYLHEVNGEIAVKDNDGEVWYSNPQNRLSFSNEIVEKFSSLFYVNIITAQDAMQTMTSYGDCVKFGQFSVVPIENGVKIEYDFGKVMKQPVYPQALTLERFEKICESLNQEQKKNLSRYYNKITFSSITDAQAKDVIEKTYPKIVDLDTIYVIKNSPSELEKKRIIECFAAAGYTAEQRTEDHLNVGVADKSGASSKFILPICITLKNKALNISIPVEEIRATKDIKIESIVMLPHMNTIEGVDTTEMIIPDGSGAVMHLGKIISGATPEYDEPIYGKDLSLFASESTSVKETISLPFYGITNKDGGMLAVVNSAAATAAVTALPRTSKLDLGSAGFKFKLMDYSQVKLLSTDKDLVKTYPYNSIKTDINVSYSFISGDDVNWVDIAAKYKQQLSDSGILKKHDREVPLYVNILGGIDDIESVLGVPIETIRPLTTYNSAANIAETLSQSFPDNKILLEYTGWMEGGIKSFAANRVKLERKLGKKSDFQALISKCRELSVDLFLDADFQYVYRETAFDGYSPGKHTSRYIMSEAAYKSRYNISNFLADHDKIFGYILNPECSLNFADTFLQQASKYDMDALALPYLASEVSSDFTKNGFIDRNKAADLSNEIAEKVKSAGMKTLSHGANSYMLSNLDYISSLSMQSNEHPMIAERIPLVQMILSGSIKYSATPINDAGNDKYYLLKCIETGSALNAVMMSEESSFLKFTEYNNFYSASENIMMSRIEQVNSQLTKALQPVYGSTMVNHSAISEGVIKVDWDNGKSIIVNYNQTEVSTVYGNIPPLGYLHAQWR